MPRRQQSRISLRVRLLVLVPLPIIAFWIYRAGQTPRLGLFEAELMAAVAADSRVPLPTHLTRSDFTLVDTSQVYDEKTLYEKVDGHDVAFFRFGFVSLTFASYSANGAAFVDLYAFRMNRRENALGIFAGERSDSWNNLDIADAGYESGGAVFFYRGPWYVQVIPSEPTPETNQAARELTDSLLASIPQPLGPLPQLAWFPKEGLIVNSEGFLPDNAFGADFLGDVFTAEYESGATRVRAFCHVSDSARSGFDRYLGFLQLAATPLGTVDQDGLPIHRFSAYGEETWIALAGDALCGVEGITDTTFARRVLKSLLESLSKTGRIRGAS
jgi:hypothetical protein